MHSDIFNNDSYSDRIHTESSDPLSLSRQQPQPNEDQGHHQKVVEAVGLSAFLSRLPRNAVENIVAASNIPKPPDTLQPSLLSRNNSMRKWSSHPNLNIMETTGKPMTGSFAAGLEDDRPSSTPPTFIDKPLSRSMNMTSPLLPPPLYNVSSSFTSSASYSYTNTGNIINLSTSSNESSSYSTPSVSPTTSLTDMQQFFVPLLHVLPETDAFEACIHYNTCRRVVTPVESVEDLSMAATICKLDEHGNEIVVKSGDSTRVEDKPKQATFIMTPYSNSYSICDIGRDDELVLQVPRSIVENTLGSRTGLNRSAYDAIVENLHKQLLESSTADLSFESFNSGDQEEQPADTSSSSDDSIEIVKDLIPTFTMELDESKQWLQNASNTHNLLESLQSKSVQLTTNQVIVTPSFNENDSQSVCDIELREEYLVFYLTGNHENIEAFMTINGNHDSIRQQSPNEKNQLQISLKSGSEYTLIFRSSVAALTLLKTLQPQQQDGSTDLSHSRNGTLKSIMKRMNTKIRA